MKRKLGGSIAISKMKHDVINVNYKDRKVAGIFLPIKENHMVEGKNGAFYIPVRVIVNDQENEYGQHGFIAQSVDSKIFNEASPEQKEEFNSLPIISNLKDFTGSNADASGRMSDQEVNVDNPKDDLPF